MDVPIEKEVLDTVLTLIHSRQHVSPKRLGDPGPGEREIEEILRAAGAAPDHGRLNPWRLIIVPRARRYRLGAAFAAALEERDALSSVLQREEARSKAFRGPFLALMVVRLDPALGETHPRERMVSAGCALQNMLLAAHAMGYGAGLSSGRALYSTQVRELFGLGAHEEPLCFFCVGTVTTGKAAKPRPSVPDYISFL